MNLYAEDPFAVTENAELELVFAGVPVKVVAVTPSIPVIFVELSPTIFPFAVMLPETVSDPSVPTLVSEELTTLDPNVVALRTSV